MKQKKDKHDHTFKMLQIVDTAPPFLNFFKINEMV